MINYGQIAVAFDDDDSIGAVAWAAEIAQAAGSEIEVIRVLSAPQPTVELPPVLDEAAAEQWRADVQREMDDLAHRFSTAAGVAMAATVLYEPVVADALVQRIHAGGADLVVMVSRHRSRLSQLLSGSVVDTVLREAGRPLLIVQPSTGMPLTEPERRIQHILVPVDGTSFSNEIIPHAAALAGSMNSRLTILRVVTSGLMPHPAAALAQPAPVPPPPIADEVSEEAVRAELVALAENVGLGSAVRPVVIRHSDPADAILSYAAEHAVDLIAMTTHGRGGLGRLLAGSVAHRVIHEADTPLLVLRPRQETPVSP